MMRAKSRIIIYHFTNTNIFSHRIHQQKITVCVCLHMVCVDVIISQDIFLYSMNKYCSCMHEKKKERKEISSMGGILHLGGRMQSVTWDSRRPPRVTN